MADDHSTLIDELARLPLVEKLATAVMTCTPPRVYGVHGDWGAGKTSFLQQLNCRLDGMPARDAWVERQRSTHVFTQGKRGSEFPEPNGDFRERALVVWFEAWRYQHEPAPVVALLHEMRGQLGALVRATRWGQKIAETVIRTALLQLEQFAKFAWLQRASGITVAAKGAGIVNTIQETGERLEREDLAEKLPAETSQELGYVRDKQRASMAVDAVSSFLTRRALRKLLQNVYKFGTISGYELALWACRGVWGDYTAEKVAGRGSN